MARVSACNSETVLMLSDRRLAWQLKPGALKFAVCVTRQQYVVHTLILTGSGLYGAYLHCAPNKTTFNSNRKRNRRRKFSLCWFIHSAHNTSCDDLRNNPQDSHYDIVTQVLIQ